MSDLAPSDAPRPRYDPPAAAALACLRWDYEVWILQGAPVTAGGLPVQVHDATPEPDLLALFAMLARHHD